MPKNQQIGVKMDDLRKTLLLANLNHHDLVRETKLSFSELRLLKMLIDNGFEQITQRLAKDTIAQQDIGINTGIVHHLISDLTSKGYLVLTGKIKHKAYPMNTYKVKDYLL